VAVYFLDSSAVVKRYGREQGSTWIKNLTHRLMGNRIYIARITSVEVVSSIVRKARGGGLSHADAVLALTRFRRHLTYKFSTVEITSVVIDRAMLLAERHALRGYDAVQLAAALDINDYWIAQSMSAITLVSADNALNEAAGAEGLAVDDPNAHP
jgi:uncharacterized protein